MTIGHSIMSGRLWHRRHDAAAHAFDYPITLMLVDLAKPRTLLARHPIWGRRWLPVTLRSQDYINAERRPLLDKVRETAAEQGLDFSSGQVLMLAQPRALGLLFNPLVLYFHIPAGASAPDGVLAEVHNTPWGETCFYAHAAEGPRRQLRFEHDKTFHVSPFLSTDLRYHWHIAFDDTLSVRIEAREGAHLVFAAGMRLEAVQAHRLNMGAALGPLIRQALLTRLRIYRQAFHLWRLRAPFYSHPDKRVREEQ